MVLLRHLASFNISHGNYNDFLTLNKRLIYDMSAHKIYFYCWDCKSKNDYSPRILYAICFISTKN
jgi:hypothetical protein